MPGVGRQELRTTGQLDQPQRPGDGGDDDEGDQRERHPPGRPGRPGGVRWPRGRSPGAGRVELRADRAGHGRDGRGALLAPQRVAEADQGDAGGNGEQPLVDLRQQGDRDGRDGADGEERGGPAGEDAGAEEGDAEEEAAADVGDADGLAERSASGRCRRSRGRRWPRRGRR